jgi:hypothetical protein
MMAITGYPFCHSAKVTSLLMHRNNLIAVIEDVSPAVNPQPPTLKLPSLPAINW